MKEKPFIVPVSIFKNYKYSPTCEEQPPGGNPKSGCSLQVVALRRFNYDHHGYKYILVYTSW